MQNNHLITAIPDLTVKESTVFLAIINSADNLSLSEIQKTTDLPKTTIHRIINSLVDKGLVVWQLGTQGKVVTKGNISSYIDKLNKQQLQLQELIEKFSQTSLLKSNPRPIVNYYEGLEGIKQLIWNTLDAKADLYVYTNVMRQDVVGKTWLTDYCMKFVEKRISDKVLCDNVYARNSYQRFGGRKQYFSPIEKFYQNSQERVVNSPLMRIKGETYIYNDTFATYSIEGDIVVGCEIISKDISSTQKAIFETLWNQTSEKDSIENY